MSCLLIDIAGSELNSEDRELLAHPFVAGVILFSVNFIHVKQLRQLISEIKKINPNAVIAVDHEGGVVQRFHEGFTKLPASTRWGEQYDINKEDTIHQLKKFTSIQAKELLAVGVNLPLTPVLDLDWGRTAVTHQRSYSSDPDTVIELGKTVIETMHHCGLPAVGKHFPGHGAVMLDSHLALPIDTRPYAEIEKMDLRPFSALAPQLDAIMPGHVVYSEVDELPAGFSSFWLREVLRNRMNFNGIIVSDDLDMGATAEFGDFVTRVELALEAGCDLVSICNNRPGVISVIDQVVRLQKSRNEQNEQIIQNYIRNYI